MVSGKGDKRRPTMVSSVQYSSNWDTIFKKVIVSPTTEENPMKGTHETVNEHTPTMEHLNDPYVLQLISHLDKADSRVEELESKVVLLAVEKKDLQLVAGRYQYLHEEAQKAIKFLMGVFDHTPFNAWDVGDIRNTISKSFDHYSNEVSKLIKVRPDQ